MRDAGMAMELQPSGVSGVNDALCVVDVDGQCIRQTGRTRTMRDIYAGLSARTLGREARGRQARTTTTTTTTTQKSKNTPDSVGLGWPTG